MSNPTHKIYCYTGTGNSFAAAKQLSAHFDSCPIEFITGELVDAKPKIELDFCVIVLPSYAFGVPKLVKRFLKSASFKIEYLAIAVLQGSEQKGTATEAIKILKKKGQAVSYSSGVDSVENYVPLFGHPSDQLIKLRSDLQKENIISLCAAYQNKETNSVSLSRPLSAFISAVFRGASTMFPAFYRILKSCNGCGICAKICPPNAIKMRLKKSGRTVPKFKATLCDHCQACLQLCPKKAIRFTKIKPTSPRYIHREVTLTELIKR